MHTVLQLYVIHTICTVFGQPVLLKTESMNLKIYILHYIYCHASILVVRFNHRYVFVFAHVASSSVYYIYTMPNSIAIRVITKFFLQHVLHCGICTILAFKAIYI